MGFGGEYGAFRRTRRAYGDKDRRKFHPTGTFECANMDRTMTRLPLAQQEHRYFLSCQCDKKVESLPRDKTDVSPSMNRYQLEHASRLLQIEHIYIPIYLSIYVYMFRKFLHGMIWSQSSLARHSCEGIICSVPPNS